MLLSNLSLLAAIKKITANNNYNYLYKSLLIIPEWNFNFSQKKLNKIPLFSTVFKTEWPSFAVDIAE